MNTPYKLLKITGAICLLCTCLTSKADPKTMTLEELRAFLDSECRKTNNELTQFREKFKTSAECPEDEYTALVGAFLEKIEGVTSVQYNDTGEPVRIKIRGKGADSELEKKINSSHLSRKNRVEEYQLQPKPGLDKVSRDLTREDLKKRGLTDEWISLFDNASIKEITFDSIVSGVFSEKYQNKCNELINASDTVLEHEIDAYVDNVTVLKNISIIIEVNDIQLTFDEETQTTMDYEDPLEKRECELTYKVSNKEQLKQFKDRLRGILKDQIAFKNGREKVVLLLLLNEMTPSECRLEYVVDFDARYLNNQNRMFLNLEDKYDAWCDFSHEVGHYLQEHLGLEQIYEDYRNPFAQKLLLLENPNTKENSKTFTIPNSLRDSLAKFGTLIDSPVPEKLTEKELFSRWQLRSRWTSADEISNILGIYFDRTRGKIYICALSDIREFKYIRYGHSVGDCCYNKYKKADESQFKCQEDQDVFENIVKKAASRKPDEETLKVLLKLHEQNPDTMEIVDYRNKSSEEVHMLESDYHNYLTYDGSCFQ